MTVCRFLAVAAAAGLLIVAAPSARAADFKISSPGLPDGSVMPAKTVFSGFGCTGGNRSPALTWSGAPSGTKSFAVTVYDPDAPTGSGWWHWTVFNIPPTVTSLPEGAGDAGGALPAGAVQGRTDFGTPGYGGPCPPPGPAHHYVFTVYALKTDKLPLDGGASGAMVGYMLHSGALASASFTATYARAP